MKHRVRKKNWNSDRVVGNAAAWNPAERRMIQTEAEVADPPTAEGKTPSGKTGM